MRRVKFVRHANMLAVPIPQRGGTLDELRPFINVKTEDDFVLLKAFLVGALRPGHPFANLAVSGEQGSAKSTVSRYVKKCIDPTKDKERSLPKDRHSLAISAQSNWLLSYGNVSSISPEMSDALCSLSTGGGYSTRAYYTDNQEKNFDYQRPLLLNGIGEIVSRPDLLDRTIVLYLAEITDEKRITEKKLDAKFEEARPRILGALFDRVADGLRNIDSTRLEKQPRMADFACWVVAAKVDDQFLGIYEQNRADLQHVALDDSPIGQTIVDLANEGPWSGTYGELLDELDCQWEDKQRRRPVDWPQKAKGLSGALTRIKPALRAIGIEVVDLGHTRDGNRVRIEKKALRDRFTGFSDIPTVPPAWPL
jgi:hypothetical protein